MKFIKFILIFALVAVVLLSLVAQLLPSSFHMERNIIIRAGSEKIHPFVNDLRKWPEWTVWNTTADPTVIYTYEGPQEGVGAISKWDGKKLGDGMMTITESDVAKGVKIDLSFDKGRHQCKGWITYVPAGTDTKVVWGFGGDVSRNPVDRWFNVFMEKLVGPEFEKNLAGLKKKVESAP